VLAALQDLDRAVVVGNAVLEKDSCKDVGFDVWNAAKSNYFSLLHASGRCIQALVTLEKTKWEWQ
jgi:hypothetical protein